MKFGQLLAAIAAIGAKFSRFPPPNGVVRSAKSTADAWLPPASNWPKGNALSRRDRHRERVAAATVPAPGPKPIKQRKHKQHHHKLRDEHGAFTQVGRNPITGARRKWLAGISAQRGY